MQRRYLIGGLAVILAIAIAVPALGIDAASSVSVKKVGKKVKKLTKRVAALEATGPTPGPQGEQGGQGERGEQGSSAAGVIQGNTNKNLTVQTNSEDRFPPSGFKDSVAAGGESQISPNATVVVSDLVGRVATAPNTAGGRTFQLVRFDPVAVLLSCQVVNAETTCDSGNASATLPPRTSYTLSIFTGNQAPAASAGARWAFRVAAP